jgi:predicted nuclease of predicted toxin-antitoxin system
MPGLRGRSRTASHESLRLKLLFDENLSPRLVAMLSDLYPGSVHVRDVHLQAGTDIQVWDYAKDNGLVIISKDADFRQRSVLFGQPPKVIGLLLGNCPITAVESLVRASSDLIRHFNEDAESAFLELP